MTWCWEKLMVFLFLVSTSALASSDGDVSECESTVRNWAETSTNNGVKENKLALKDLLFFLHIPRTGGRTYYHCFLRKLYNGSHECPRSYDKLHFDPSKPNCRLMVTHDDYSVVSKLPKESTSVVTVLRNPVDRVFSTYEFSVEVAARFLVHPNLTSATHISQRVRKSHGVSTLDIWPWKHLVPWMREDLFARRDARKLREAGRITEIRNSYDAEDMAMPLRMFIDDAIAHDIIHNGATFQVAGLTNNSYSTESHKVRHCVRKHPTLARYVLEIAKNRLDHMLYVGLTEDHKNSATMFANMVGAQVLSQSEAWGLHAKEETTDKTEPSFSANPEADGSDQAKQKTVGELMEAYEGCISTLRGSQVDRHINSLKSIGPANFTKEARLLVPETVIQQILSLNSLDVELYRHAQDIFLQQRKHLMKNISGIFKQHHSSLLAEVESETDFYGFSSCKIFLLAIAVLLVIVLVSLIASARRTSKLKL